MAAAAAAPAPKHAGFVVVTGATSGIGEATARTFIEGGYKVLAVGRRVERLDALKKLAEDRVCVAKVDVTEEGDLEKALATAEKQFGEPVGLLVNNAGLMQLSDLAKQDMKEIKAMLDVNVMGVIHGYRAVLDGMRERKSGMIITISSIAGKKAFGNHAAYCASKFAIDGLVQTVREETAAAGVRHCVVYPGVVETELLGHTTDSTITDGYKQWVADQLQGERLQPQDVADCVFFAYQLPARACAREIILGPSKQVP